MLCMECTNFPSTLHANRQRRRDEINIYVRNNSKAHINYMCQTSKIAIKRFKNVFFFVHFTHCWTRTHFFVFAGTFCVLSVFKSSLSACSTTIHFYYHKLWFTIYSFVFLLYPRKRTARVIERLSEWKKAIAAHINSTSRCQFLFSAWHLLDVHNKSIHFIHTTYNQKIARHIALSVAYTAYRQLLRIDG